MSKGPGQIESRIADLFAATRDRGLSVAEITDHAFALKGRPASRAQRLSATRAAHRVIRRIRDTAQKRRRLIIDAHDETEAAVGEMPKAPEFPKRFRNHAAYEAFDAARKAWQIAYDRYNAALKATEPYRRAETLDAYIEQFGSWMRFIDMGDGRWRGESEYWRATADKHGTLYFHPPDVPIRIWAVDVQAAGVIWAEAEVGRITEQSVTARYAGDTARLDRRRLWEHWALWRNVYFVSSRSGHAAQHFDEVWQERFGRAYDEYGYANADYVPPAMRMPLADAIALLKVPANYTKDDILAAFRREVKKAHPDLGGMAEMFDALVKARDRLLAALGTSAPAPKPPRYAPRGAKIVYGSSRASSSPRIGSTRRLA
jgi:hypothetical protein